MLTKEEYEMLTKYKQRLETHNLPAKVLRETEGIRIREGYGSTNWNCSGCVSQANLDMFNLFNNYKPNP